MSFQWSLIYYPTLKCRLPQPFLISLLYFSWENLNILCTVFCLTRCLPHSHWNVSSGRAEMAAALLTVAPHCHNTDTKLWQVSIMSVRWINKKLLESSFIVPGICRTVSSAWIDTTHVQQKKNPVLAPKLSSRTPSLVKADRDRYLFLALPTWPIWPLVGSFVTCRASQKPPTHLIFPVSLYLTFNTKFSKTFVKWNDNERMT